MQHIFNHLEKHDFKPCGVNVQTVMPQLEKNLEAIDYEFVKKLEGITNIPCIACYIKALNVLDIKPLRQVYICLIATEYTLEGRTIEEMNGRFKHMLPEKFQNYEELTQGRMDELNKMFPFMTQKENAQEQEEEK